MAKSTERNIAKQLYMQGKPQNEIAAIVTVTEKTIGDWVKKYGWKAEREARQNSSKNQIENIKNIISAIAEDRFNINNQLKEAKANEDREEIERLQKEAAVLDDGAAKWNKTLMNIDKENRISVSIYIEIMEDIFKQMQNSDPKLYMKTIAFQDEHISTISLKLG